MPTSRAVTTLAPPRTTFRPWRRRLLALYLRRELPGWGRLYDAVGGPDDARWSGAGIDVVRGKLHGFEMELDLANWSERLTWFLGRYHDLPLQLMLRRVLRAGDHFVDIGANLGMLSLLARGVVGDRGRVLALEPNPRLVQRVQRVLERNGLANVEVVHTAVSDRDGEAELHEYGGHPGWGSLSSEGPEGANRTHTWTVGCRTGDELLADLDPAHPLVIKIDVEGHEVPVLHGLQGTLERQLPLVFCEVVDAHQRRAGFSAHMLRAELERHGYRPFVLEHQRRGLWRHDVVLMPLRADDKREVDVLFVPPSGELAERVGPLLPG